MPRQWKHKVPRKKHSIFFVANDIPSNMAPNAIINEVFGTYTKSAEAMAALIAEFEKEHTLTLSDRQVNAVCGRLEGVSKGAFYAALKDMVSLGIIRRDESGFYSLVTDFSSALRRIADAHKEFVNKLKQ